MIRVIQVHASFFLLAGLLFVGCGKSNSPAAKPTNTSSNPLTAPVDYLGAAARAQHSASKIVGSAGLDQAIKMFYGQEGRYPKDLNELVPSILNRIPPPPRGMKFDYDPKTGAVKIVPE